MPLPVVEMVGAIMLTAVVLLLALEMYIRYLRRDGPPPNVYGANMDSPVDLARFRKLDGKVNSVFLVTVGALAGVAFLLLRSIASLRFAMLPPADLTYPESDAYWLSVAVFAGIGLGTIVIMPLCASWWPQDIGWYEAYLSVRRYRCDYRRLCRGLGIGMLALAVAAIPLGWRHYVQLRGDVLEIHPFLGLDVVRHRMVDIAGIDFSDRFVAPNGKRGYRWDFIVHFRDGGQWVASDLPSGDAAVGEQLALLLSVRSEVPIRVVREFQAADFYADASNASAHSDATPPSGEVWGKDLDAVGDEGWRLANRQQYRQAEHYFKLAQSWAPDDPYVLANQGDFYAKALHQWDKAWDVSTRIIKAHPELSQGWVLRAIIQKDQPRPGLADTEAYIVAHFSGEKDMEQNIAKMRSDLAGRHAKPQP